MLANVTRQCMFYVIYSIKAIYKRGSINIIK